MKLCLHDTGQLKAQLLAQLPRLVECLFADRTIHRTAHEYRIGTQGSISLRPADGCYFNHESGEGGDIFTMIEHVLKTDFKGALTFAKNFIGNAPLPLMPPTECLQKKLNKRTVRQRDKALAMIKRRVPIEKTLAEAYLHEKRGISLEQFPSSLGFIAHAYNYTASGFYPAMIATVLDIGSNPIAAHCTFIDPTTGNKLRGTGIKSRLIFGACRGGAIRLSEATERLALCEGIEDGLSVLQCSDWPVWATGGTSGLRSVRIPLHVREVMICSDNDAAGKEAAKDLSTRLISEGKRVRIAIPPTPHKDFNDLLRCGGSHAS